MKAEYLLPEEDRDIMVIMKESQAKILITAIGGTAWQDREKIFGKTKKDGENKDVFTEIFDALCDLRRLDG